MNWISALFKAYISFPYLLAQEDGSSTRNWAHMTFTGDKPVDRRLIKRAIRGWVKKHLGRTLHCRELNAILKRIQR